MRTILFCVFAGLALAAEPVAFIQMSDPQFGMQTNNAGFEQETASFEFAIATANRLKPAFVVVTGDLINEAGNVVQAVEYQRIAGHLNPAIKLYNIPGNHDVGNEPTTASLAAYRNRFGADYYSFREGSYAGIVLNSSLIAAPAKAMADYAKQEAWLRNELKRLGGEAGVTILVFQHHPYFLSDPAEADQYFNIPLERRKLYLELFREAGVAAIFAGHYHRNSYGRDGKLEMITTGPVGRPEKDAQSGMRIVRLSGAGIKHEYFPLGSLPNQLPN